VFVRLLARASVALIELVAQQCHRTATRKVFALTVQLPLPLPSPSPSLSLSPETYFLNLFRAQRLALNFVAFICGTTKASANKYTFGCSQYSRLLGLHDDVHLS